MRSMREKEKNKEFEDPLKKVHNFIDSMNKSGAFDKTPPELQKVIDNINFLEKAKNNPLPPGTAQKKVFGVETWDINAILKDNIWNRSIFTVDKLCKLFLKADLEQKKKYLKKKNPIEFDYAWLLILIFGVAVAFIVIMFLGPKIGFGL